MAEIQIVTLVRWRCPRGCGQVSVTVDDEMATRHLINHMLSHHPSFKLEGEVVERFHLFSPTYRRKLGVET